MKAVIYHADSVKVQKKIASGIYKKLILGLKENLNKFEIPLVHLTLNGFEGWGDENYFYPGDADEVILNRELTFIEFLKKSDPDEIYWFTEPDSRIIEKFPNLEGDLALLYRNDSVPISPAWRLARKTALPFFEELITYFNQDYKDWHGDSWAFRKMWEILNRPELGKIKYKDLNIEFRRYDEYCKRNSKYSIQWKGTSKINLLGEI